MAWRDLHRFFCVVLQITICSWRTVEAAFVVHASAGCAPIARWAAGIEAIGRHSDERKVAAAESFVLEEDLFICVATNDKKIMAMWVHCM
jgi:hypothetical protein